MFCIIGDTLYSGIKLYFFCLYDYVFTYPTDVIQTTFEIFNSILNVFMKIFGLEVLQNGLLDMKNVVVVKQGLELFIRF